MTDFSARRVMMVDTQVRPSDVTKFPIIAAMLAIPRERFVPDAKREAAYVGSNLPLSPGRVVLEARTLAKMLEAVDVQPTDRVLDLACGLGYATAVVAEIAGEVVGIDDDADLAAAAQAGLAGVRNARAQHGDLTKITGQFDVILVEGGVEHIPASVTAALAEGGRIAAIFMEGALGTVKVGTRLSGRMSWRFAFNASAPVLKAFAATRDFTL